ncbi:hypothetical protein RAB80_008779 [Fusarium oxysporum f. sp. vasinfectum]|uniref:Uncharacterized protein n=1 Tax=Fusarium oxysporum f. sp. vasinfectum 25433 TaxID=1089449 RepID=X0MHN4_FUSOX|nr:hypothetical protein FOTG_11901 [Fusarium oxysporum f. sp. vasinfectum 25433]KAK2676593.1 hypothetical protein RAB80_008779 [Fusarium oxysporum f. sp. vasinfectum]KAK2699798.1 hypothetical protein QWA68_000844 [Fusarium oxysporum]KAK2933252.1 hypothetical protein FoTM2_007713 [Fusarium oxysporum f. sp. vasinfectum]
MRVLTFALALFAADMVVEAGVCKPALTTTAVTSIVESSTATASAASETSFTESLTSATETLSTDSSEILTASTTEAETTSTEAVPTTTTEAVSTTTEEASTTTTAGPSYTPGSLVGTGPVAGLTLHGTDSRFIPLSFTPSDSTQTLIFTLAANGQLATGNNNNYLCLNYKPSGVLGPLVLCPFDNFSNAPLKCTRAASGTLSCTVPNGSCEASGTCRRPNNAAAFSQFYVDGSQNGYFGPSDGNFGADYTAIDVILAE